MTTNSITSAFDMLLDEFDQTILDLNTHIIDLTTRKEFNKVQAILDKAKRVSALQQKVQSLCDDWIKIDGQISGKDVEPVEDLEDIGKRTPSEFFHIPLLQALVEMGGKAHCQRVIARVGQLTVSELSEFDWQTISDGKTVRWENNVHWARNQLRKEGLILPMEKRSYWEISPKGRQFLEENSQGLEK